MATSGGMPPEVVELCRGVVNTLMSERYKDKNYLFLHPFDLSQTPGYTDVVQKLMDLGTLSSNLESGAYATRQDFFQDACRIFENAVAYHANRETKWIAKLGKEMLKITQRERKTADKKMEFADAAAAAAAKPKVSALLPTKKNKKLLADKKEGGGPKLKLKLGSGTSPKSAATDTTIADRKEGGGPKLKLKLGSGTSPKSSSATDATTSSISDKKEGGGPKLKLKIGSGTSPKSSATDTPVAKPKVSIKLKGPSQGKQAPPAVQQKQQQKQQQPQEAEEKKNKKPRLTLKWGKPKIADEEKKVVPAPKPTSGSGSGETAIKISGPPGGGSRGKELPKGVAPPKSEPKKPTKKATTPKATMPKTTTPKATTPKATTPKATTPKATTTKPMTTKPMTTKPTTAKPITTKPTTTKPTTTKPTISNPTTTKTTTKSTTKSPTKSTSASIINKVKSSNSATSKAKSKTKISFKASSSTASTTSTANRGGMLMTSARKVQCAKLLSGLKRRKHKAVVWFLQPVADKAIVADYKAKIPHPMDLSSMQTKLEKNEYTSISAFALDLRRIFANCLRYNTSIKDSLRPVAVEALLTAEQLMTAFLAKPENPTVVYPPLLFCWKLCLSILDTLYNLTNPEDGQPTALYFLFPVSFYCGGQFPPDYLDKVSQPMDFGTVTAKLIEGQYLSVGEFEADCKLVIENCMAYYGGTADGKVFTDQANRLKVVLQQQMDALNRYMKSPAGAAAQRQAQLAVSSVHFPKPPIPVLLGIMEELKALKYIDKATKVRKRKIPIG
jgi:cell division septation protein DedD